MFDEKQKCCVKCIYLVTDDGLYDRNAFCKVKIAFIHPLHLPLLLLTKITTKNIRRY